MKLNGKCRFVVSERGKQFNVGGNKPVFAKALRQRFDSPRKAEYWMTTTLGSTARDLFVLKEMKKGD